MSDPTKWTIAFSHFTDFVQNLPVLLDEGDVEQYHYIIGLFENALDSDLSRFKVGDDRIKRPIQNPVPCLANQACCESGTHLLCRPNLEFCTLPEIESRHRACR